MNNNVNSNAKIITSNDTTEYKFGNFITNDVVEQKVNEDAKLDDSEPIEE